MLVLLLDAAVILGLARLFNEGKSTSFGTAVGTAIAVALGFFLCFKFLGPHIGLFALLPMVLVAAAVLWITCDVPPKKAVLSGGILLGYKIALALLVSSLLG